MLNDFAQREANLKVRPTREVCRVDEAKLIHQSTINRGGFAINYLAQQNRNQKEFYHVSLIHTVSILIQPEGWMLCLSFRYFVTLTMFQSSSSPKAGCYSKNKPHGLNRDIVSILIQPEGWMLCISWLTRMVLCTFQSSSSPKAGCYVDRRCALFYLTGFNPHPARRLDAIICNIIK